MKRLILLIGILCPPVLPAADSTPETGAVYPQQMNARDLLKACASSAMTRPGRERRRYCDGFVSGVEEGARLLWQETGTSPPVCVPGNLTSRRLSDAYIGYASSHRSDLDKPAAAVVLDALRAEYPCNSGG